MNDHESNTTNLCADVVNAIAQYACVADIIEDVTMHFQWSVDSYHGTISLFSVDRYGKHEIACVKYSTHNTVIARVFSIHTKSVTWISNPLAISADTVAIINTDDFPPTINGIIKWFERYFADDAHAMCDLLLPDLREIKCAIIAAEIRRGLTRWGDMWIHRGSDLDDETSMMIPTRMIPTRIPAGIRAASMIAVASSPNMVPVRTIWTRTRTYDHDYRVLSRSVFGCSEVVLVTFSVDLVPGDVVRDVVQYVAQYNMILTSSRQYCYFIEGPTVESISARFCPEDAENELGLGSLASDVFAQISNVIISDGFANMFTEHGPSDDEIIAARLAADAHLNRVLGDAFLP